MELNFRKSESTVKPLEVELNDNLVYIRKNIIEEDREDVTSGETVHMFVYDEALITNAEYQTYLVEQAADEKTEMIMDALAELASMVSDISVAKA